MCTCLGVCLGFCLVSGLLPEHACICVGVWVVALDLTVSELLSGLVSALWDLVAWVVVCGILLPGVCAVVSPVAAMRYLRYLVICRILLSATLAHWHTRCALLRAVHACSYMRARTSVLVHPCMHRPCLHASMLVCAYMHSCTHVCVHSRCVLLRSTAAWVRALTRAVLGCVKHVARRKTCLRDQNAGVGIHVLPRSSRRPLPLPPRRSH